MARLRFYLDENVPLAVAEQLVTAGIDAVSARSLGRLGESDEDHLREATRQGRVLCTHDKDFLRLAASGVEHSGIAFARQSETSIGGWVRALQMLHVRLETENVVNRVIYLRMR